MGAEGREPLKKYHCGQVPDVKNHFVEFSYFLTLRKYLSFNVIYQNSEANYKGLGALMSAAFKSNKLSFRNNKVSIMFLKKQVKL